MTTSCLEKFRNQAVPQKNTATIYTPAHHRVKNLTLQPAATSQLRKKKPSIYRKSIYNSFTSLLVGIRKNWKNVTASSVILTGLVIAAATILHNC